MFHDEDIYIRTISHYHAFREYDALFTTEIQYILLRVAHNTGLYVHSSDEQHAVYAACT
jgi:hypothetical protein